MWGEFPLAKQFLTIDEDYSGGYIQGSRNDQEDDFGFDNSKANDFLLILADGMGGYEGGAIASNLAVKTFMDAYHAIVGNVAKRLRYALQKTNQQLALRKKSPPKLKDMGCTLVGVALNGKQMEWISVGDSPLWLYNAGRLERLNADHSIKPMLQLLLQQGELTLEQVANHPNRNMLRSAVSGDKIELIDQPSTPLELYPGDRILLASDGIFTLSEVEIQNILQQDLSAQQLVQKLLQAVQDKNKYNQDNTTVLVVKIPETTVGSDAPKRWRWQTSLLSFLLILVFMLWIGLYFQLVDLNALVWLKFIGLFIFENP
jgi:serine/threonine protein phosphatase PrpC